MADVPPPSHFNLAETVGTVAAIAAGAAVGAIKFFERFKSTQKMATTVDAEIDVIDGLRTELQRLSEQNGKLADSLNDLQNEVVLLRRENAQLHLTVDQLNTELSLLRRTRS